MMFRASTSVVVSPCNRGSCSAESNVADTSNDGDLVFPEKVIDSLVGLADDVVLAGLDLFEVEVNGAGLEQALLDGLLHFMEKVCVAQKRLRGDTAAQRAGAAEPGVPLDDDGLQAQLRGADRGDIAARARADDCDVEWEVERSSSDGPPKRISKCSS